MAGLRMPWQVQVSNPLEDQLREDTYVAAGQNQLQRGFMAGRLGGDANYLAAQEASLRAANQDAEAQALRDQIGSLQRRASIYAPAEQDVTQLGWSPGRIADWTAAQVGQGAASMLDPMAAAGAVGVAARFVPGPMGALARTAQLAAPFLINQRQQAGETYNAMVEDPALMARTTPQERMLTANVTGAAQGALDTALPAMAGARLAGKGLTGVIKGLRPAPAVGLEMLGEGATEAAQQRMQQAALGHLNPDRDTSGDANDLINAFAGGAAGSGPISAGSHVAYRANQALDSAAGKVMERVGKAADAGSGVAKTAQNLFGQGKKKLEGISLDTGETITSALKSAGDAVGRTKQAFDDAELLQPAPFGMPEGLTPDRQDEWLKAVTDRDEKRLARVSELLAARADDPKAQEFLQAINAPAAGPDQYQAKIQAVDDAADYLRGDMAVARTARAAGRAAARAAELAKRGFSTAKDAVAGAKAGFAAGRKLSAEGTSFETLPYEQWLTGRDQMRREMTDAEALRSQRAAESPFTEAAARDAPVADVTAKYLSDTASKRQPRVRDVRALARELAFELTSLDAGFDYKAPGQGAVRAVAGEGKGKFASRAKAARAAETPDMLPTARLNRLAEKFVDLYGDSALQEWENVRGIQAKRGIDTPKLDYVGQQIQQRVQDPGGTLLQQRREHEQLAGDLVGMISPEAESKLLDQGINLRDGDGRDRLVRMIQSFANGDNVQSPVAMRKQLDSLFGRDAVSDMLERATGESFREEQQLGAEDAAELGGPELTGEDGEGETRKIAANSWEARMAEKAMNRDPGALKYTFKNNKTHYVYGARPALKDGMEFFHKDDTAKIFNDKNEAVLDADGKPATQSLRDLALKKEHESNGPNFGAKLVSARAFMKEHGLGDDAIMNRANVPTELLQRASAVDAGGELTADARKATAELTKHLDKWKDEHFVIRTERIAPAHDTTMASVEANLFALEGRKAHANARRLMNEAQEAGKNKAAVEKAYYAELDKRNVLFFPREDGADVPIQAGQLAGWGMKRLSQNGVEHEEYQRDEAYLAGLQEGIGALLASNKTLNEMPYRFSPAGKREDFSGGIPPSLRLATGRYVALADKLEDARQEAETKRWRGEQARDEELRQQGRERGRKEHELDDYVEYRKEQARQNEVAREHQRDLGDRSGLDYERLAQSDRNERVRSVDAEGMPVRLADEPSTLNESQAATVAGRQARAKRVSAAERAALPRRFEASLEGHTDELQAALTKDGRAKPAWQQKVDERRAKEEGKAPPAPEVAGKEAGKSQSGQFGAANSDVSVVEHPSYGYQARTKHNADSAGLTVAIASDYSTAGERLTARVASGKYLAVPIDAEPAKAGVRLAKAMRQLGTTTLNVAGNGIYTLAATGRTQEQVNRHVYETLKMAHELRPITQIVTGGQTGVDIAGAVAARALGIPVVVTMPRGFKQRNAQGRDLNLSAAEVTSQIEHGAQALAGGGQFGGRKFNAQVAEGLSETKAIMAALGFKAAPPQFADVAAKLLSDPRAKPERFMRESAQALSHLLMAGRSGETIRTALMDERWADERAKLMRDGLRQGLSPKEARAEAFRVLTQRSLAQELKFQAAEGAIKRAVQQLMSAFRAVMRSPTFDDIVRRELNRLVESVQRPLDLKRGFARVTFQQAIDADPAAAALIAHMSKNPDISLTGSIVLAHNGAVYRDAQNMLHDVDFRVAGGFEAAEAHLRLAYPGATVVNEISDSVGSVRTYIVPPPGAEITNLRRQFGDKGGVVGYEVTRDGQTIGRKWADETGEHREGESGVVMDFFPTEADTAATTIPFLLGGKQYGIKATTAADIFDAKLAMGRDKDLLDYLRYVPAAGRRFNAEQNRERLVNKIATDEEVQQARDYINKVLGSRVKAEFGDIEVTMPDGTKVKMSGEYIDADKVIRLATSAGPGVLSVAYHEAMHGLWADLGKMPEVRQLLTNVTDNPAILNRINALLAKSPLAQAQLGDAEERVAYAYQFWAAGMLDVGRTASGFFAKIQKFLRRVFGLVTDDERAAAIFQAFHDGKLAEPSAAGIAINDILGQGRWPEKARKKFDAQLQTLVRYTFPSHTVLAGSESESARKVAKLLFNPPGSDEAGEGMLNAQKRWTERFINEVADTLHGMNDYDLRKVEDYLQGGVKDLSSIPFAPHREAVDRIRKMFDRFHKYAEEGGLDLGRVENYYPRVWDLQVLHDRKADFIKMLLSPKYAPVLEKALAAARVREEHGDTAVPTTPEEMAERMWASLADKAGVEDKLDASREDGVLTPYFQSSEERQFTWLDDADIKDFMEKNLIRRLTQYFRQGVRAVEYTRRFGVGGERLKEMLDPKAVVDKGKGVVILPGIIETELLSAAPKNDKGEPDKAWVKRRMTSIREAIGAMEGTLGKDISPAWRKATSWAMVYQNLRLLPLALFSAVIDPLGMMARGGTADDAYKGFVRGMRDVVRGWKAMVTGLPEADQRDEMERLAEMLGTVGSQHMLDSMGQAYTSAYLDDSARRVNNAMFVGNGMEAWNRAMRVQATGAAVRFIEQHAKGVDPLNSERWLRELGLYGNVPLDENGRLIVRVSDLLSASGGKMSEADVKAAREWMDKVHGAIARWVDGAILAPNSAQRPGWASDPHCGFLFHLKQFTYSFQQTLLRRAVREAGYGNLGPVAALSWGIPMMITSDIVKGLLQGGGELPAYMKSWNLGDWLVHGWQRAGGAGVGQLGIDASHDPATLLGPTVEQITDAVKDPAGQTLTRAVPLNPLLKGAITNLGD